MTALNPDWTIKKGALEPPIKAQLTERDLASTDPAARKAIDLTNATSVTLYAKLRSGKKLFNGPCTMDNPRTDGRITFAWVAGQSDVIGYYNVEFLITWSTGRPQRVPNAGYNLLEIEENLA